MDAAWFHRLPKIELHVHVESAMTPACLLSLCQQDHGDDGFNAEALNEQLHCHDFHTFQRVWMWKQGLIRSLDDYEVVAASAASAQADDGIIYCAFMFSPFAARQKGLDIADVARALLRGFKNEPRIQCKLIADLTRDAGARACGWMLDALKKIDDPALVGIGLGGSEHQFPCKSFKQVFKRARAHGFHCSAHAGEKAGADSVRDAVMHLRVDRVGHGTRAIEDPALLEMIAEKHISIDACPTSNLQTAVINNMTDYPLRAYLNAGINVTINTDNPIITGKRLSQELEAVADAFDLNEKDVIGLQHNALQAAWIDHDERARLQAQLDAFI